VKIRDADRFPLILLAAFAVVWVVSAIEPWYPSDWWLENVLVFIGIPTLIVIHRNGPLSRLSYSLLFVFLCLHETGAHYTYAEVPYDKWFAALTGSSLNDLLGWDRNHFDRLVHFLWGVLLTVPIRELLMRSGRIRGFLSYFVPFLVIVSSSTIYELIEWQAALLFGGDLGMAYLGTQGDIWDAHKDTLMATTGGFLGNVAIWFYESSTAVFRGNR
jgi:putative membrane protein